MSNLADLLKTGSVKQLKAKKRSCLAYRDKLARQNYTKDERIDVEYDIRTINERIGELENDRY